MTIASYTYCVNNMKIRRKKCKFWELYLQLWLLNMNTPSLVWKYINFPQETCIMGNTDV